MIIYLIPSQFIFKLGQGHSLFPFDFLLCLGDDPGCLLVGIVDDLSGLGICLDFSIFTDFPALRLAVQKPLVVFLQPFIRLLVGQFGIAEGVLDGSFSGLDEIMNLFEKILFKDNEQYHHCGPNHEQGPVEANQRCI